MFGRGIESKIILISLLLCKTSFHPQGAAALTKIRQAFLLWHPRKAEL